MARHLLGLGHRRIAVVTGSQRLTTVADRLAGVEEAMTAAGLCFGRTCRSSRPSSPGRAARRPPSQVIAEHPDVTAVLALNDDMAIGVLSVLRARGVAVPERVSVAGFDDVAVAQDLAPSLTTVRLPMVEMGAKALAAGAAPTRRPGRDAVGSGTSSWSATRPLAPAA